MTIAFFDFDGTITSQDSLTGFIRFAVGRRAYLTGLLRLSPMLAAYTFKLIPNDVAKAKLLAYFFRGWSAERFREKAAAYSLERIDRIVRPQALERIAWHRSRNHRVVIVSASLECWLKPWCDRNGLEVIATKLEIRGGLLTGRFLTENCYGAEKAARIREIIDLGACESVYAYGDSRGDRELLELAHHRFYKPFRD